MKIRLVMVDLDDTLLKGHAGTHPNNLEAIQKAQLKGVRVCACTGRSLAGCKDIIVENELDDYCVTCNGASVMEASTNKHLYRNRIAEDYIQQLIEIGISYGASVNCHTSKNAITYGPTFAESSYGKNFKNEKSPWHRHRIVAETVDEMVELVYDKCEKIDFRSDLGDHFSAVKTKVKSIAPFEVAESHNGSMEITAPGAIKGEGIKVLAGLYDVPREQVLAIGDGHNDISMIEWAGIGVAVGYASDSLKEVADHITEHSDDGGVADAIYKFVL